MKINITVFYKLVVSFLLFKTRHAQSTQNNKFVISLYYLQKEMRELLKYLKYIVIALLLYWGSMHLAAINFQLLNLAIWFDIWKRLSVEHAVFGRFINHISAFNVSPVLDLTSTLNLFDFTCWVFVDVWVFDMVGICLMMRWWDRFWWKWGSI